MKQQWKASLEHLKPFFDRLIRTDESGTSASLFDEELGDQASCCTTAEVAAFYLAYDRLTGGNSKDTVSALAANVVDRQLPEGGFPQPYYVKKGENGSVDIAEIGAAADALYHIHKETGSEDAKLALVRSADYLLTQVAKENPGAVYKNPNAANHDVLNGDIYAAHTLGRAFELTGEDKYSIQAERIVKHVADRFGKHEAGWWPYIENWDGSVGMGNSVSYQGTIIAFAHTLLPMLSPGLAEQWQEIEVQAAETMLAAMAEGPNDHNEAPWWCRDWNNAWEIYLGLWRVKERFPDAAERIAERLRTVEADLKVRGAAAFQPKVTQEDQERTPVTTTFRKAATFAGIVSYMILD